MLAKKIGLGQLLCAICPQEGQDIHSIICTGQCLSVGLLHYQSAGLIYPSLLLGTTLLSIG